MPPARRIAARPCESSTTAASVPAKPSTNSASRSRPAGATTSQRCGPIQWIASPSSPAMRLNATGGVTPSAFSTPATTSGAPASSLSTCTMDSGRRSLNTNSGV